MGVSIPLCHFPEGCKTILFSSRRSVNLPCELTNQSLCIRKSTDDTCTMKDQPGEHPFKG